MYLRPKLNLGNICVLLVSRLLLHHRKGSAVFTYLALKEFFVSYWEGANCLKQCLKVVRDVKLETFLASLKADSSISGWHQCYYKRRRRPQLLWRRSSACVKLKDAVKLILLNLKKKKKKEKFRYIRTIRKRWLLASAKRQHHREYNYSDFKYVYLVM